jgi:hypothetical protein
LKAWVEGNTVEKDLIASDDESLAPLVSLPARARAITGTSGIDLFGAFPTFALADKPTSGTIKFFGLNCLRLFQRYWG